MDNENNYNNDNRDPASNDYGGSYHYDFDLNQQKNDSLYQPPNGFASASLVLGILSLVLCCCCYVSVPLGALGILFAILSKRDSQMSGRGRAGLWLSIVGLCLTVLFTLSIVISFVKNGGFRETMDDYLEYYMGDDYDPDDFFPGYGEDTYPDRESPDRFLDDIL